MTADVPTARVATVDDVDALVALRVQLLQFFGWNDQAPDADRRWIDAARDRFATGIAIGDVLAVVVEDLDGCAVDCGVAEIVLRLPSPALPDGRMAHTSSIFTRVEQRGTGLGRLVVRALLAELHRRGIDSVELHAASPDAERLYVREGFARRTGGPLLRFLGSDAVGG